MTDLNVNGVTYDILYQPSDPTPPTDLALDSLSDGKLVITWTDSTSVMLRWTVIEVTQVEDDWTVAEVIVVPKGTERTLLEGYPGPLDIWARAFSVSMFGAVSTLTGEVTITTETTVSGIAPTHWEVVMASGITYPPDPVVTSDGTDWVYTEVPD